MATKLINSVDLAKHVKGKFTLVGSAEIIATLSQRIKDKISSDARADFAFYCYMSYKKVPDDPEVRKKYMELTTKYADEHNTKRVQLKHYSEVSTKYGHYVDLIREEGWAGYHNCALFANVFSEEFREISMMYLRDLLVPNGKIPYSTAFYYGFKAVEARQVYFRFFSMCEAVSSLVKSVRADADGNIQAMEFTDHIDKLRAAHEALKTETDLKFNLDDVTKALNSLTSPKSGETADLVASVRNLYMIVRCARLANPRNLLYCRDYVVGSTNPTDMHRKFASNVLDMCNKIIRLSKDLKFDYGMSGPIEKIRWSNLRDNVEYTSFTKNAAFVRNVVARVRTYIVTGDQETKRTSALKEGVETYAEAFDYDDDFSLFSSADDGDSDTGASPSLKKALSEAMSTSSAVGSDDSGPSSYKGKGKEAEAEVSLASMSGSKKGI